MTIRQKLKADGTTVDLDQQEAEQAHIVASAKRVIIVNASGTIIKATQQEENRSGSDCSGSDGVTGRVLTLQNTSESGAPVSVWVEDSIIAQADMTVSHLSANSTITFDNIQIYNTDTIRVLYYI